MNKDDPIKNKGNPKIKVISIGVEHANECLELDQIALNGLWNNEQWIKELSNPRRICLGIYKNSRLVAFVCSLLISDELNVTAIAVHPQNRRIGLGENILSSLIEKAKKMGAKKVFLETKSTNYSAIGLYKKLGFKSVRNRKNYYRDGSDACLFSHDLIRCNHINKRNS